MMVDLGITINSEDYLEHSIVPNSSVNEKHIEERAILWRIQSSDDPRSALSEFGLDMKDDFSSRLNQKIYEAMHSIYESGNSPDISSCQKYLEGNNQGILISEFISSYQEDYAKAWPDPEPLAANLPSVAKLIPSMIPEPVKDWAMDTAERMQVPVDFIVAPFLVTCGSIIGTSCKVRPKKLDDWEVTPNTWGGIVAGPSMLKTPALNEAIGPIRLLEKQALEQYEEKVIEYKKNDILNTAKKKALQTEIEKAAKNETSGKHIEKSAEELIGKFMTLEEETSPTERRYKTNDSSIEKIVELLNENPRGLLYFRDELIGLFKRAERVGNEQDRAFLLESWNGNGSHTDDRIGRGTVRTDNLCLSLLGGIQPDKIASYLHGAINDNDNDGFVQRLQLMVYPDPIANWQYKDQQPNEAARERVFKLVQTLAYMQL